MTNTPSSLMRCAWVTLSDPLYVAYHDQEWGVPQRDDHALFALLALETAQAGLSWATILHKRRGYESCFAGLDPATIATFGEAEVRALCQDPRIVRNERKIRAVLHNARAFQPLTGLRQGTCIKG